ncbi:MAG: MmgE/PrpD family protein [Anaerolineales bacterium]|nr:MmgE/PrpD family protein [Anaerolineales bacterium]
MALTAFIHDLTWGDLSEPARLYARRCLLDTVGAGLGGRGTELSRIVFDYAALAHGGRGARLWLDGREVSPVGAALAHGMTVDSLDVHDGHKLTKGHAGAALVPALLAAVPLRAAPPDGRELLTALAIGYEVAIRAGIALHATTCDYHTSGAWNALGCAAIVARWLGSGADATRHALGIAEYHGPRSQMMRCIDYPTMLKDGSGWGAMTGVSAGLLAHGGFTGAPALTVEAPAVAHLWADLGQAWHITEQYFKPYAVCYWAQAPVHGVLQLQRAHGLTLENVRRLTVHTFHEAVCLDTRRPANTEEAQYSLPFPVAAALRHGELGPAQLSGAALQEARVLQLAEAVELIEAPEYSARFPAERLARVTIETTDGRVLESGEMRPRWDVSAPPGDAELLEKFRWLARLRLPEARAAALEAALWRSPELADARTINDLLAPA